MPGELTSEDKATLQAAYGHLRARAFREALQTSERLRARYPENAAVLALSGSIKMSIGQFAEGVAALEKAAGLRPSEAGLHHDLSQAYKLSGDLDAAHRAIDDALRLKPAEIAFQAAKAELHSIAGETEQGLAVLRSAVRDGAPHLLAGLAYAKLASTGQDREDALQYLQRCLARQDGAPMLRTRAIFAIADLHDALGHIEQAIEAYRSANASVGARFDSDAHSRAVTTMIETWTAEQLTTLPRCDIPADHVVFVLGMPRSGTTLVEQVLASLPGVFGAGELGAILQVARQLQGQTLNGLAMVSNLQAITPSALRQHAQSYHHLLRQRGGDAKRIIDKSPLNFLQLGLISRMFPGARIIHCTRDPMDTCFSCYCRFFMGNLAFAYDMNVLGRFYRDYERLMAHWKGVLDTPILDVAYEDLVADLPNVSRRMAAFIDLEWDQACLEFYKSKRVALTASNDQVRKPLYSSSVRKWRKYEAHLKPLEQSLAASSTPA